MYLIVVALGGNAILQKGETGTAEEQLSNINNSAKQLAQLISAGHQIAITHGNGPQIGNIYIQNSLAGNAVPAMPLDVCSAESQGLLGYMLAQSLQNELNNQNINLKVVSLLTQMLVDKNDKTFDAPSKPIGPFHNEKEAKLLAEKSGFTMKEDSNRGWRRVVASPKPKAIIDIEPIKELIRIGTVPILCGGGGIPVIKEKNKIKGIEAVIDKDLASSLLAREINADILLILTDVEKVYLNFGKKNQKAIDVMSIKKAKEYLKNSHFKEGSMKPKIEAAIEFVRYTDGIAIITSLNNVVNAVNKKGGTRIER